MTTVFMVLFSGEFAILQSPTLNCMAPQQICIAEQLLIRTPVYEGIPVLHWD